MRAYYIGAHCWQYIHFTTKSAQNQYYRKTNGKYFARNKKETQKHLISEFRKSINFDFTHHVANLRRRSRHGKVSPAFSKAAEVSRGQRPLVALRRARKTLLRPQAHPPETEQEVRNATAFRGGANTTAPLCCGTKQNFP